MSKHRFKHRSRCQSARNTEKRIRNIVDGTTYSFLPCTCLALCLLSLSRTDDTEFRSYVFSFFEWRQKERHNKKSRSEFSRHSEKRVCECRSAAVSHCLCAQCSVYGYSASLHTGTWMYSDRLTYTHTNTYAEQTHNSSCIRIHSQHTFRWVFEYVREQNAKRQVNWKYKEKEELCKKRR